MTIQLDQLRTCLDIISSEIKDILNQWIGLKENSESRSSYVEFIYIGSTEEYDSTEECEKGTQISYRLYAHHPYLSNLYIMLDTRGKISIAYDVEGYPPIRLHSGNYSEFNGGVFKKGLRKVLESMVERDLEILKEKLKQHEVLYNRINESETN